MCVCNVYTCVGNRRVWIPFLGVAWDTKKPISREQAGPQDLNKTQKKYCNKNKTSRYTFVIFLMLISMSIPFSHCSFHCKTFVQFLH